MDREAFKQRMRNLKSYRENNPGKGYWDWKVTAYADGGQTGDPDKERFYQATGRSRSGRPLEEGLKPVFDLEDAANMTPIGDAISARDTYNAVKERDWLGAGLAAATMIPFVPMTVKQFRRKYKGVTPKREVPTVNRTTESKIDALDREMQRRAELINQGNNQGYKIAERLMEDPSYIARAAEVQKKYGDDYLTTYADILQAYNESPKLLPKAKLGSLGSARARMETAEEATRRHRRGGEFPYMGEYNYRIDPSNTTDLSGNITEHEWNHFVDYLKNKSPEADGNSNLFYQMSKDIIPGTDSMTRYYSKPTEQKAYMNQLREYMYESGILSTRGDRVSKNMLENTLKGLTQKNMDSVIRASKQFKNMNAYTRCYSSRS